MAANRKLTKRRVAGSRSRNSGHENRGWFKKGQPGPALKTGHRSALVKGTALPELAETRARINGLADAITADLGGASELSTIQRELIRRLLETSAIADFLANNILSQGVLTTKGKSRAAVGTFLSVVDRIHRLSTALGLERRARQLPSPQEFLRQRAQGDQS